MAAGWLWQHERNATPPYSRAIFSLLQSTLHDGERKRAGTIDVSRARSRVRIGPNKTSAWASIGEALNWKC